MHSWTPPARTQIFIDGGWVESAGEDVISVLDPATEETLTTVPRGTAEDVDRAARAAAAAFENWSRSSLDERVALFERVANLIEARWDEIVGTIVREVGAPLAEAIRLQSPQADLDALRSSLREIAWAQTIDSAVVHRQPCGVVGTITPWNVPLKAICVKAAAAIAAGCTVVLKGSEIAPTSSFTFAEILAEAGAPAGVLNVVSGTGPEVGEAIATHPLIDMVSLTGSVRAGRRVMQLAAGSIKRVALELGGKSANIILEDADIEHSVTDGIADAFRNTGQACGGLTRMLVPRHRLAEAEELAVTKAESYVPGDPFGPATTLGPVATAGQRDRIRGYITSGLTEGGRCLTGGPGAPDGLEVGYFVRPTVLTGTNAMKVAREEVFGPVVVIIPYDAEAEAIAIANDSPYGLAAGVWSADAQRARAVATRLRVGRVRINGAAVTRQAPHGGFKLSGIGREWGRYGIEEFLEYQSVIG
jgi:aldehyde dehydrogenase (NAD+)